MRKWIWAVGVALLACLPVWAQEADALANATEPEAKEQAESPFPTQEETISYAIGWQYGKSAVQMEAKLDLERLMEGIRDGYTGAEPKLTQEQVQQAFMTLQQELVARHMARQKKQGEENLAISEAFLAENAKKPGVVTLPSGLQYKVIEEGTGDSPELNNRVTVHYTGKLLDGTVFDTTQETGEPAKLVVSEVIPGWTEALQLMKVGSKWELYIPPALAYEDRGAGQVIGPNQMLIFEVQLLEVAKMATDTKTKLPARGGAAETPAEPPAGE
jgi:FKBP-type peptidyl-prolyl cis-trans isomerase FklB